MVPPIFVIFLMVSLCERVVEFISDTSYICDILEGQSKWTLCCDISGTSYICDILDGQSV